VLLVIVKQTLPHTSKLPKTLDQLDLLVCMPHLHCCVKIFIIQVVFHRQVKVIIVVQVLLLVVKQPLHHNGKLSSTLDHTSKLRKTPDKLDIYPKPHAPPPLLRQTIIIQIVLHC
jgi:hypothetical protein